MRTPQERLTERLQNYVTPRRSLSWKLGWSVVTLLLASSIAWFGWLTTR